MLGVSSRTETNNTDKDFNDSYYSLYNENGNLIKRQNLVLA